MIRFTGHLDVDHTPEEAFELLADMTVLDKWNPNVRQSRRVAGDRFETGSRYESTLVRGPIRLTAHSELIAVEPGASVTYEGSIGSFWSVDTLEFQSSLVGTRITFSNQSTPPTWLKPFTPLINAAFQRQALNAIDGARAYLAQASA